MDPFMVLFPVSGVKTLIFIPPLVAFLISFFTSMSGVSGAFLLLPFQMSFLNYTTPSVSATNFVFNIAAIPGGVLRFIREQRMAWPLAAVIVAGTVPGVLAGYYIRVRLLPDPVIFKAFAGIVLLYIGLRLVWDIISRKGKTDAVDRRFADRKEHVTDPGLGIEAVIETTRSTVMLTEYRFWGEEYSFNTLIVFLVTLFVGIIGGAYGIGGGAIIAPFLVTVYRLPVYTIAGATLLGTFMTSICGVLFYSILPASGALQTSPDWLLGILFGAGGFCGIYLGARAQKYVPQNLIKMILAIIIVSTAIKYCYSGFSMNTFPIALLP